MGALARLRAFGGRMVAAAIDPFRDPFRTDRLRGPLYQAGGQGQRLRGLSAATTGPTATIVMSAEVLRNRSRQLLRDNSWARSACETFVANVVGTGFTPHPLFGSLDEGDAAKASAGWVRDAKNKFRRWAGHADADGGTFDEICRLAVRGMFEAGDTFVVRIADGDAPAGVPLQLRVWEAEMLPLWKNENLPGGAFVRAGIEFDARGTRVAYHFYKSHPGEFSLSVVTDTELRRVPASEVLHFFRPIRPGQVRGEPWLAPVVLRLHDLGGYSDAELVRKKAAANFVFKIEAPDPDNVSEALGEVHDAAAKNGEVDTSPGSVVVTGVGETFNLVAPADVGPNFAAFVDKVLHEIAAGVGLTYEMLTGDLSQVNYSSIRAGTLEFRRRCEPVQYGIVCARLADVWAWWLDAAVAAQAIVAPRYGPWREDYLDIAWVPPGWDWVDPEKEVKAALLEIDGRLTSRTRVIARQGEDVNEIRREIANEVNADADAGLTPVIIPTAAWRGSDPSAGQGTSPEPAPASGPGSEVKPAKTGTNG